MNKKDESFKDFVLDQLRELPDVEAKRMFGSFVYTKTKPASPSLVKASSISRSTRQQSLSTASGK